MMHKLWLKKLKLSYEQVSDIVQFGSSVMENGSPNDIDIAVVFNKIPVKVQLEEAQKIKRQLQEKTELPIPIKSFDLYSFFEESNFARENILFYGKSIILGKPFAEKFGLTPRVRISYSLKNLKKKDKIRFNYMLNGKKKSYGLLRKYSGELVSPGVIEILPEYEDIFVSAIKTFKVKFQVKKIMIS